MRERDLQLLLRWQDLRSELEGKPHLRSERQALAHADQLMALGPPKPEWSVAQWSLFAELKDGKPILAEQVATGAQVE